MDLKLHSSMGDHLMGTGLPEAYYKYFGEKVHIPHQYSKLFWINNPYITPHPTGKEHTLIPNASAKDYMIYYPARIFYDMTGWIVDRKEVQPNIYFPYVPQKGHVLINDQAGWPTRRNYRFFDELIRDIRKMGYKITYLRNENFRDCMGRNSPKVITHYDNMLVSPSMQHMIDAFRSSEFYIGYDSGLSQLAGALKVPYVLIEGPVSPINTVHDTCVYVMDGFCPHCNAPQCEKMCLSKAPNKNEEILEAIERYGS